MPYSSIDNILKNVLDTGITNKFFWNHRKTFSFKDGVFYSYQEPIGFLHNGLLLVLLKAKNLGPLQLIIINYIDTEKIKEF